jgi:hypothetical protein
VGPDGGAGLCPGFYLLTGRFVCGLAKLLLAEMVEQKVWHGEAPSLRGEDWTKDSPTRGVLDLTGGGD